MICWELLVVRTGGERRSCLVRCEHGGTKSISFHGSMGFLNLSRPYRVMSEMGVCVYR